MEREKLLIAMASVMEIDVCELHDDYDLKGHGIDSLVIVSIIAAIDIEYGVRVQGGELDQCQTVKEIFNLIELKKNAS